MSNVKPFPITRCLHHIDMMRCCIEAEPTPNCRKALLRQYIEEHRKFLAGAGVEPHLIERELRDLRQALNPAPTGGGVRLRRAA